MTVLEACIYSLYGIFTQIQKCMPVALCFWKLWWIRKSSAPITLLSRLYVIYQGNLADAACLSERIMNIFIWNIMLQCHTNYCARLRHWTSLLVCIKRFNKIRSRRCQLQSNTLWWKKRIIILHSGIVVFTSKTLMCCCLI